jgi:hypothetical protein
MGWMMPPATYNHIKARSDDEADSLRNQYDQKADDEKYGEALYFQWPTGHDVNDDREEKAGNRRNREIDDDG